MSPHGDKMWKRVFGEVFFVASYILACHVTKKFFDDECPAIFIGCDGFTVGGKQKLEVRQLYKFFLLLFRNNNIEAAIIIDKSTKAIIDDLLDVEYTILLNQLKFNKKGAPETAETIPIFRSQRSVSMLDHRTINLLPEEKSIYYFFPKSLATKETVRLLGNKKLDFLKKIESCLSQKTRQTLDEQLDNAFGESINTEGKSIYFVLRKPFMSEYDVKHPFYYFSTRNVISTFFEAFRTYNNALLENNEKKRFTKIFIKNKEYNKEENFFNGSKKETPESYIRTLINNDFKIYTFDYSEENEQDDDYLLIEAYRLAKLKNYGVTLAVGPCSGGVHALPFFDIPAVFPATKELEKQEETKENKNDVSKTYAVSTYDRFNIENSLYFPIALPGTITSFDSDFTKEMVNKIQAAYKFHSNDNVHLSLSSSRLTSSSSSSNNSSASSNISDTSVGPSSFSSNSSTSTTSTFILLPDSPINTQTSSSSSSSSSTSTTLVSNSNSFSNSSSSSSSSSTPNLTFGNKNE